MREPPIATLSRMLVHGAALMAAATLTACASTTFSVEPGPQTPVCDLSATALVAWGPHWRPDQKDVPSRDAAAADGLRSFFAKSGCFSEVELVRVEKRAAPELRIAASSSRIAFSKLVGVEVLELGPVVKLLSSAALVEGGTNVVLRIIEYSPETMAEQRRFLVRWHNGGHGVIKGVASLRVDMEDAIRAGFKPSQ